MKINKNYLDLQESYLFSTVNKKATAFAAANPDAKIIRMSIGDVTLPLCDAVVKAMQAAAAEMGKAETFRGYGPEQGYDFLKESIQGYYGRMGVSLGLEEIFISDGAKSDVANILDIMSTDNIVLIPDPVYPVYLDTNIMAGRKIIYADANIQNGFLPLPDESVQADIIYLCSPNNPTGAVYTREMLTQWVDYAIRQDAVILYDAAYECFIEDQTLPRSIYQVEKAKTCAIEFCSFSKTAGFTGTRCGYTVVPQALEREGTKLAKLWLRRQTTKFNGVPYVIQRGAAAVFSEAGMAQTLENIAYYKENAKIIAATMREMGVWYVGGENSPYIWMKCPDGTGSWDYFDHLLEKAHVVSTPGAGFGKGGEGFLRLTAFNSRENTEEAMARLKKI